MARIRSVSPGLRTSETAAQWSREARYTWVLLWGYLDDYGRGVDNARVIALDCYPLDDDVTPQMMTAWLDQYQAAGSICRYEFEGKKYLHVLNWADHQKPQHPSKARIVPCPHHEGGAHQRWLDARAADHAKVSGNAHEPLMSPSPTSRGGGEVSWELSEGGERGGASGAAATPPAFPDHCRKHAHIAEPGPCGACADVRKANTVRPLQLVPATPPAFPDHCRKHAHIAEPGPCGACADVRKANTVRPLQLVPATPTQRCLIHAQPDLAHCSGCAADRKAIS